MTTASWSRGLVLAAALAVPVIAAPGTPPGHNVHLVREGERGRFWRGGAPRAETLRALARSARERGVPVTLVDLRVPPTRDDLGGKGGRLSPAAEARLARELGLRYVAVSALDRGLLAKLGRAVEAGDVYLHCMYGVNRTGFAVARWARDTGQSPAREGLGERDWRQGEAFQDRLAPRGR